MKELLYLTLVPKEDTCIITGLKKLYDGLKKYDDDDDYVSNQVSKEQPYDLKIHQKDPTDEEPAHITRFEFEVSPSYSFFGRVKKMLKLYEGYRAAYPETNFLNVFTLSMLSLP